MTRRPGWKSGRNCASCLYPIVYDDVFGWLHADFGPRGRSFDHRAVADGVNP